MQSANKTGGAAGSYRAAGDRCFGGCLRSGKCLTFGGLKRTIRMGRDGEAVYELLPGGRAFGDGAYSGYPRCSKRRELWIKRRKD